MTEYLLPLSMIAVVISSNALRKQCPRIQLSEKEDGERLRMLGGVVHRYKDIFIITNRKNISISFTGNLVNVV